MMQFQDVLAEYWRRVRRYSYKPVLFVAGLGFLASVATSIYLLKVVFPDIRTRTSLTRGKTRIQQEHPTLSKRGIEAIIARNVFNKNGKLPEEDLLEEEETEDIDTKVVIKSNLPLKLIGTIYGGDALSGLALIQNVPDRSQNSFLVGDVIMENVTLVEVHRYKVIMLVRDHREYIELDQTVITRGNRGKKKGRVKSQAKGLNQYTEAGFERVGSKIVMSSDYKQNLLGVDFAKVLQDAKAEPYLEAGELAGFRLSRIKPDSIYEKAGLIDDDVIKEINGVSLTDTGQTIRLLNSLRGESEIEFQVMRGGSVSKFTLQVK